MPYVYSTATASIRYTEFKKVTKDINQPVRSVTILGGSNVANQKTLVTPLGVPTQVSQDDLDWLLKDVHFQKHMDRGYMKIEKTKKDSEKVVAAGMQTRDNSAPETPETLAEKGAKLSDKPTKGKGKDKH
jgi:hypothetical protein